MMSEIKQHIEKKEYDCYVDLLIIIMNFDKNISKYFYSEGIIPRDIKSNTNEFIKALHKVYKFDKLIYNSKALTLSDKNSEGYVVDVLEFLDKWVKSNDKYPLEQDNPDMSSTWYYALSRMLMCMQVYLIRKLKKKLPIMLEWSSYEFGMQKKTIKWENHLDFRWVDKIDDKFLKTLSQQESLILVADIRRSQDLMTYCNPDDYMKEVTEYLTKCRELITKHNGLYDRNTGDGFIAYFNPLISEKWAHKQMYSDMLACVSDLQAFSTNYFDRWTSKLRKLPIEKIGLSIGVDEGLISYKEIDNQLFAIGDGCLWANRMCEVGHAKEIVLNNIPARKIEAMNNYNVSFDRRNETTKNGEMFVASVLKVSDLNAETK